jgi:hypothetical protein
MRKLNGHIFQPLTPWLAKQGVTIPQGWNLKSANIPECNDQIKMVEENVEKCQLRILKKITKNQKKYGASEGVVVAELQKTARMKITRTMKIQIAWNRWTHNNQGCMYQSELEKHRELLRRAVICPVDKHNGEGIILCPRKYGKALRQMTYDMQLTEVQGAKLNRINENIGTLGSMLSYLPFCQLRPTSAHRFGAMRLWVKLKVFESEILGWNSLKWRPLVSYRQHKWRKLYAMTSRL